MQILGNGWHMGYKFAPYCFVSSDLDVMGGILIMVEPGRFRAADI